MLFMFHIYSGGSFCAVFKHRTVRFVQQSKSHSSLLNKGKLLTDVSSQMCILISYPSKESVTVPVNSLNDCDPTPNKKQCTAILIADLFFLR